MCLLSFLLVATLYAENNKNKNNNNDDDNACAYELLDPYSTY